MASNSDIIVLESSDDEEETDQATATQPQRSIRADVDGAKRLLLRADLRSRPNAHGQADDQGIQRYSLSSRVTANDLLRNVEFREISDVLSRLQIRLSAERIFNIGLPQTLEEREIFDELLMRYSADLLSGSNDEDSDDVLRDALHVDREDLRTALERLELERQGNTSALRLSQQGNSAQVSDNVDINSSGNIVSSQQGGNHVLPMPSFSAGSSLPHSSSSYSSSQNVLDSLLKIKDYLNLNIHENGSVSEHAAELSKLFQVLNSFLSANLSAPDSSTPSKSQRKRPLEEKTTPPSNSKKAKHDESDEEEEACSICFEVWSSGGEHRICCLKCGHLFGLSCITKWIEQAKCCPQCKLPAKKTEIRSIFARRLTVEDTSQRDRALKMLEEERQTKRTLEHKEALSRKHLEDQIALNKNLQSRLAQLESGPSSSGKSAEASGASSSMVMSDPDLEMPTASSSNNIPSKKYHPLTRVNIAQEGNCRVFEYSGDLGMIIVSTKSSNPLFRGFGIKTVSREFRCLSYQPLHSAAIRDMSFRPGTFDGTLLSCGMDKVIQLTSVTSNCVIQKYTGSGTGWCCAWNGHDTHLFYVGMERGVVKEFDIRRTDSHVQDVVQLGGAPITSLHYWNGPEQESGSSQGLLIGHVRDIMFKRKQEEGFSTHLLHSTNASMTGLSLHHTGLFLVSNRPGVGNALCKYETCQLNESVSDTGDVTVKSASVASWDGSNLQVVMSRNALFSMPESDNHILAATANHSSNKVNVWDVTRRQPFQVLNSFDKALDIKPIHTGNQDILGVLSESDLTLYKWR